VKIRTVRLPARVDVFVTVPAATQPGDAACPAGLDRLACFARHRVEWRAACPGPGGRSTWHFRAPDAESVRIALRHNGIPFESVRVADPAPPRQSSPA
jgi:hypothetical protein